MPKQPITRRELSQVRTVRASGPDELSQSVCCTRRQQTVSAVECMECPRLAELGLTDGRVTALFCDAGTTDRMDAPARRLELPVAPVGSVIRRAFTCVRAELTLDAVTAVFLEYDTQVLPVVDSHGALLGLVHEADVQLEVHVRGASNGVCPRTVQDVRFPYPLLVSDTLRSQKPRVHAAQRGRAPSW